MSPTPAKAAPAPYVAAAPLLVRKPPVTGGWTRQEVVGIAYALAEVNRKKDAPTVVREVLVEAGITMKMLRSAKVDAFDLKELRKCFPRGAR